MFFTYPMKKELKRLPIMNKLSASIVIVIIFIGSWMLYSQAGVSAPPEAVEQNTQHPVLVELFTSQGCSSCPPADRVLQRLHQQTETGKHQVIALSFHVDYWNRLGWNDPYSHPDYSLRQREYADYLPDRGVYTPQLVINGRSGHVGSREKEVRVAIAKASTTPLATQITLQKVDGRYNYTLAGRTDNIFLQIATVDAELNNAVPRGENRGRDLSHVRVVREWQTIDQPDKSGSFQVDVDKLAHAENGSVVVVVQDKSDWQVTGVVEVRL